MPIASKLVYFQRRPSPAPPNPGPEPPDPRRRPCRDHRRRSSSSLSSHHKPESVPGHQIDASSKSLGSAGKITEHVAGAASSGRLHRSVSDHGRLPDAVQQARERLLQRLNSVDLSGRRQKPRPSETFWAGRLTRPSDVAGVSTSYSDSILGSLTNCFQPCESVATNKGEEGATELIGANEDECTPMTVLPEPVTEPLQEAEELGGATEASPVECSICLERCGDPDDDGLVQLPCRHVFHSACLERWLRSRGDCPYCRAAVRRS